jgi:hypothetical protein
MDTLVLLASECMIHDALAALRYRPRNIIIIHSAAQSGIVEAFVRLSERELKCGMDLISYGQDSDPWGEIARSFSRSIEKLGGHDPSLYLSEYGDRRIHTLLAVGILGEYPYATSSSPDWVNPSAKLSLRDSLSLTEQKPNQSLDSGSSSSMINLISEEFDQVEAHDTGCFGLVQGRTAPVLFNIKFTSSSSVAELKVRYYESLFESPTMFPAVVGPDPDSIDQAERSIKKLDNKSFGLTTIEDLWKVVKIAKTY